MSNTEREAGELSPIRRRIEEAAEALDRAAAELARHETAAPVPPSPADERYRLILESATDYGIITMAADRRITAWNVGACNVLGWREEEALGRSADMIFTPEDLAAGEPEKEAAIAAQNGRAADERWHMRKDGSRFWASGILTLMRHGGYLKILRDRTAEREAEQRQNLLLAELQHRVRNMLAVIRSVAARTVETSASLEDFASHFDGRLSTLARTQNILFRGSDTAIDLEELVRDELVAVAAGDTSRAQVKGPRVCLRQGAAEIFALALHELATNAVKYGALSQPKGKLNIEWRVFNTSDGRRLSLEWRERGVPAIHAQPERTGFGRTLIEQGLPHELGAATALEFARGGVCAIIELPLTEKTAFSPDDDLPEGAP